MECFPFPDKTNARQELSQDLLYRKIPDSQKSSMIDLAWDTGVQAAKKIRKRYPSQDAEHILFEKGVQLHEEDKDQIIGNTRYFSDYYSGRKEIFLYLQSVQKWADSHKITFPEARDIILYHELFHHLECHEPALAAVNCYIPRIKIGKISLGRQKIHALSEVGAYGFSRTCYESRHYC